MNQSARAIPTNDFSSRRPGPEGWVLWFGIGLLLLVGCSRQPVDRPASVPTFTSSPSRSVSTATPRLTASPASTATIPDPTPEPLPPANVYQFNCLTILDEPPADATLEGTIAYWDEGKAYLLDLAAQEVQEWNKGSWVSLSLSTDGNWLAYSQDSNDDRIYDWLIIESIASGEQRRFKWQNGWRAVYGWAGSEHVLILKKGEHGLLTTTAIHAVTGHTTEFLREDFPGTEHYMDYGPADALSFHYINYLPDPALTQVVYPAGDESGSRYINLWDLQTGQVLASIQEHYWDLNHDPVWADDSSFFVIPADPYYDAFTSEIGEPLREWYRVSRAGQVEQLTRFGEAFTQVETWSASLSPDNRFLAFWSLLEPSPTPGWQLALLDLESGEVTNFCVPGAVNEEVTPPIWSPDGQYILAGYPYGLNPITHYGLWKTILIDPFNGWAWEMSEHMAPQVWMRDLDDSNEE